MAALEYTRKVQMPEHQGRITLPKKWLDANDVEDKDEVKVEWMQRKNALKIKLPEE